MLALLASIFLTNPAPLQMPQASAYFVRDGSRHYLEDRYDRLDLWTSRTVDGRWFDDDGRFFLVATLTERPPAEAPCDATVTRLRYAQDAVKIEKRDLSAVREALAAIVPFELPEKGRAIRQLPRGYDDVDYWEGTNRMTIVCAFRREHSPVWRAVVWDLVAGDEIDEMRERFEDEYLRREFRRNPPASRPPSEEKSEREALRTDARHSVTNYAAWQVTDGEAFSVLDDLTRRGDTIVTLTNELTRAQASYARIVPTGLEASNHLSVVRIFDSRAEYRTELEVNGLTNMDWSAAYWDTRRRELVGYRPAEGLDGLVRTFRHEAFHQYLSYATSFITVSPWLNEGYAQYFEDDPEDADGKNLWWRALGDDKPSVEELDRFAEALPAVLLMDYTQFYEGSDAQRRLNYALAKSIAQFLEKGAPAVRFQPFKDVKKRYFEALFETEDMHRATAAAFPETDFIKQFKREWLKFFKD